MSYNGEFTAKLRFGRTCVMGEGDSAHVMRTLNIRGNVISTWTFNNVGSSPTSMWNWRIGDNIFTVAVRNAFMLSGAEIIMSSDDGENWKHVYSITTNTDGFCVRSFADGNGIVVASLSGLILCDGHGNISRVDFGRVVDAMYSFIVTKDKVVVNLAPMDLFIHGTHEKQTFTHLTSDLGPYHLKNAGLVFFLYDDCVHLIDNDGNYVVSTDYHIWTVIGEELLTEKIKVRIGQNFDKSDIDPIIKLKYGFSSRELADIGVAQSQLFIIKDRVSEQF